VNRLDGGGGGGGGGGGWRGYAATAERYGVKFTAGNKEADRELSSTHPHSLPLSKCAAPPKHPPIILP
jgi:hypothetical protein